jgi:hypothetical protein
MGRTLLGIQDRKIFLEPFGAFLWESLLDHFYLMNAYHIPRPAREPYGRKHYLVLVKLRVILEFGVLRCS